MANKFPDRSQDISLTSYRNCSSRIILHSKKKVYSSSIIQTNTYLEVLTSIKVIRSSLFPTANVVPSGDQARLIFSPKDNRKENQYQAIFPLAYLSFRWSYSNDPFEYQISSLIDRHLPSQHDVKSMDAKQVD